MFIVTWLILLVLACPVSAAARDARRAVLRDASRRGPSLEGEFSFGVPPLRAGYRIALRRIYSANSCQALFTSLSSDGIEVLKNTTYTMAEGDWQVRVCRDAEAFTTVGGSRVWLCRGFGWMTGDEAAIVLLHEALHSAGLGEQPSDPNGPTAEEIDEMVKRACRF